MSHDLGKIWYIVWEKYGLVEDAFRRFVTDIRVFRESREGENLSSTTVVIMKRKAQIVTTVSGVVVTKRRKRGCITGDT